MKNKQNNSLRASALQIIRYPKFAARYICALGLIVCFAQYAWAQGPDLNIVAHQDDDILFMNPDVLNAVVAGHHQVTVYITAGNVTEDDQAYAIQREEGAIAGYSKLLQLADAIRAHHFDDFTGTFQGDSRFPGGCSIGGHCFPCEEHACELAGAGDAVGHREQKTIGSRTLNVARFGNRVLLIFLRVQTPCEVWGNNECPTRVDLHELFTSPDNSLQIGSPFDQPGYTKQELITQLTEILQVVRPSVVRTQDTADGHNVDFPGEEMVTNNGCVPSDCDPDHFLDAYHNPQFYDHSDHVAGALFAREALRAYHALPHVRIPTYSIYKGYNLEWAEDPTTRVSTRDFCLKKSIMRQYALHDFEIFQDLPYSTLECFYYFYIGYQGAEPRPLP